MKLDISFQSMKWGLQTLLPPTDLGSTDYYYIVDEFAVHYSNKYDRMYGFGVPRELTSGT